MSFNPIPLRVRRIRITAGSDQIVLSLLLAQRMNVSGEFTVNAPRDAVYKVLRDATS
jgi:hypothetical protein